MIPIFITNNIFLLYSHHDQRFESGAHQVSSRAGRRDAGKPSGYIRLGEPLQELSGRNAEGQLQTAMPDEDVSSRTCKWIICQNSKPFLLSIQQKFNFCMLEAAIAMPCTSQWISYFGIHKINEAGRFCRQPECPDTCICTSVAIETDKIWVCLLTYPERQVLLLVLRIRNKLVKICGVASFPTHCAVESQTSRDWTVRFGHWARRLDECQAVSSASRTYSIKQCCQFCCLFVDILALICFFCLKV